MSFVLRKRFAPLAQKCVMGLNQFNKAFSTLSDSRKELAATRQNDEILTKQWWSQPAFGLRSELNVPVYDMISGEKGDQVVSLNKDIFGKPLRRDLVHNVYHHEVNWQRKTTHRTKTQSEISGSGKKPFQQKGTGRARQGNKRAPGRKGGAKAHGPVPRDYTQNLPQKMVLLGLKTILSARVAEGRFRIVDDFALEEPKTKLLNQALSQYSEDQRILIVHGEDLDDNFWKAQRNIHSLTLISAQELKLTPVLKHSYLFITKSGLAELEADIFEKEEHLYRNRKIPLTKKYSGEKPTFSEEELENYRIKSKSLQNFQYLFTEDKEGDN